jgi:hypothetical protein
MQTGIYKIEKFKAACLKTGIFQHSVVKASHPTLTNTIRQFMGYMGQALLWLHVKWVLLSTDMAFLDTGLLYLILTDLVE